MESGVSSADGSYVFVSSSLARLIRLRKSVYNAGMEISENLGKGWIPWMVTLTYRGVDDWRKNHIKDYLQRVRVYMKRRGLDFHYVWVAELQKRGAVHYHVIVWLPRGFRLPYADKRGWWPHGFTEQKPARKGVGYLMKYTSKGLSGMKFPKGIRIYGFSRSFFSVSCRVAFYKAPRGVRDKYLTYQNCYLIRKVGGFLEKVSGFFHPTPCQYAFMLYSREYGGVFLRKTDTPFSPAFDLFLPQVQEFLKCQQS